MYRVDGLIDYYFQRKLTGMDLHSIKQSLESQQHIEETDRSNIIQEVIRREEAQRRSEARKKAIIITGLVGTAIIASLVIYLLK